MTQKRIHIPIIFLALIIFLTACGSPTPTGQGDATEVPVVVDDFAVVAEGRLVPNESVRLSFVVGGQVAEILVEEGSDVKTGDVIARLGDREPLEAAVAAAELEISAAELELASAKADLLTAQEALDAIHDNWPDQATLAQQALKDARQRQYNADRNLGYLTTSAGQTDIDIAYTQMILAEDALERAKDAFEPYENKPADNLTRAAFQSRLAEAQKAYDAAVRHYNALVGTANEFDVSQGEAELAIANAQLKQAQEDYNLLIEGPDPDDIALADARITAAEARLVTADERIKTAHVNLLAAQANLDNLDLIATIDGTIVELDLIVGEQIAPGVPVILLVDFSQWYIETDNLTEIEVVDVSVDQKVTIVPDALPDVELTGTVDKINDMFEEKRGDVTYTTRILVDKIDLRLRWGMTVVVTFEE
ncbi:MAG: HlyD family secretion protein [Anaerolineales bacterium]